MVRLDGVGGMTYFVKRGDEPIRPVIFVKIGGGSGKREDIKTAVKELSLLHELGHVDDFIKQINIVAGRAKTSQRGALKTGQCFDDAYTSSV